MPYNKEDRRKYYLKNKERFSAAGKEYYLKNKEHIKKLEKKYRLKNKERIKEYYKEWLLKNSGYNKKYRLENKEKLNERRREYMSIKENRERKNKKRREFLSIKENRERKRKRVNQHRLKHRERINKNIRLKRASDHNFRLKSCLRGKIRKVVKGEYKSASTMKLLGCTIDELWVHLESKFEPEMTRENHGKWHVDHIIPCASFDFSDPEQQKKCFHYTNLQPLWAVDNIRKGAKIISGDITSPKM